MSGCAFGPYALSYDPPVDCPVTVVARASDAPWPHAWVYRGNVEVDVTGEVLDLGDVELETHLYTTDCSGTVIADSSYPETYKRWSVTLNGVEPGEQIWMNWIGIGTAQPATTSCPADLPMPAPECRGSYDGCGGDDFPVRPDGGVGIDDDVKDEFPIDIDFNCNAGGSSAWLVGVGVALAMARKRKRRSR